jgi:hypothetical protein
MGRVMGTQLTHQDIFGAVKELCANTISEFEDALVNQRERDEAEATRVLEEQREKADIARKAAECEEMERQERAKKIEQDRRDILATERELEAKKQALRDAEMVADDGGDDEDEVDDDLDDIGSDSVVDDPVVSLFLWLFTPIHPNYNPHLN